MIKTYMKTAKTVNTSNFNYESENRVLDQTMLGYSPNEDFVPEDICSIRKQDNMNAIVNYDVKDDIHFDNQNGSTPTIIDSFRLPTHIKIIYHNEETNQVEKTEFYFVIGHQIRNNRVVTLQLRLDALLTYWTEFQLALKGYCLVERMHWDRFNVITYNDGGTNKPFLKFNNERESAIWNTETDLDIKPSIISDTFPLGVVERKLAGSTYPFNFKAWYPVALAQANVKYTGAQDVMPPTNFPYTNKADSNLIDNIFSNYYAIIPLKALPKEGASHYELRDKDSNTITSLNDAFGWNVSGKEQDDTARLLKVFLSPMPPVDFEYSLFGVNATNVSASGDYIVDSDSSKQPILTPSQITPFYKKELSCEIPFTKAFNLEPNTFKVDKTSQTYLDYDYKREPKLYTSNFLDVEIRSINGNSLKVLTEYVLDGYNILNEIQDFSDNYLQFLYNQTVSYDGIVVKINPYNGKNIGYTNDKLMISTFKEMVPFPKSDYYDWAKANSSQYKVGLQSNTTNTIFGAIGSIVGGVTNLLSGKVGNAVGSGVDLGGGIASGINKERMYSAQVADLKNMGTTPNINDTSVYKDMLMENYDEGWKHRLNIYTPTTLQQKHISMYLNKYGYETNNFIKWDINLITSRKNFNYIKIGKISEAIILERPDYNVDGRNNIPPDVIQEFDELFSRGIRFWHNERVAINDYTKENWEINVDNKI